MYIEIGICEEKVLNIILDLCDKNEKKKKKIRLSFEVCILLMEKNKVILNLQFSNDVSVLRLSASQRIIWKIIPTN